MSDTDDLLSRIARELAPCPSCQGLADEHALTLYGRCYVCCFGDYGKQRQLDRTAAQLVDGVCPDTAAMAAYGARMSSDLEQILTAQANRVTNEHALRTSFRRHFLNAPITAEPRPDRLEPIRGHDATFVLADETVQFRHDAPSLTDSITAALINVCDERCDEVAGVLLGKKPSPLARLWAWCRRADRRAEV